MKEHNVLFGCDWLKNKQSTRSPSTRHPVRKDDETRATEHLSGIDWWGGGDSGCGREGWWVVGA